MGVFMLPITVKSNQGSHISLETLEFQNSFQGYQKTLEYDPWKRSFPAAIFSAILDLYAMFLRNIGILAFWSIFARMKPLKIMCLNILKPLKLYEPCLMTCFRHYSNIHVVSLVLSLLVVVWLSTAFILFLFVSILSQRLLSFMYNTFGSCSLVQLIIAQHDL